MPYRQVMDPTLSDCGLSADVAEMALRDAAGALKGLQADYAAGKLPFLSLTERRDDLDPLQSIAEAYRQRFNDVLVLGTGGSSLGGQAICALAESRPDVIGSPPRLHFVNSIDPHSWSGLLAGLDLKRTGVLAISKSGATAETVMQLLAMLQHLERRAGGDRLPDHVTLITEPGQSPLRTLAERYGLRCLDHSPDIGGRYAAFSLVALLPAMIAGLDAAALRTAAQSVLQRSLDAEVAKDSPPALGAALAVALAREGQVRQSVFMPYHDRLAPLAQWYRQLWAESLGKAGAGTTPVDAQGPLDQHSQLQLYLDGPRDKVFTLLLCEAAAGGDKIDPNLFANMEIDYLMGHSFGDLLLAEARATGESLRRAGVPLRILELEDIHERSLGALMMHFMLETLLAADLFGVDPQGQPAVEESKELARQALRTSPS